MDELTKWSVQSVGANDATGQPADDTEAQPDVRRAAKEYRRLGVAVCRIRHGEKRPTDRGWTTGSAGPDDFEPGDNIGLVCGWPSDGGKEGQFLVCVDLDVRDAIEKAEQFLPPTGGKEGRDGKPRSHWWYFVTDVPDLATSKAEQAATAAVAAGKSPGPFKKGLNHAETGERVIDFQGTGGQAVVPPSIHEGSGEPRRWETGCSAEQIATVPFTDLWEAVCRLAEACGAKVPLVGPRAATGEIEEQPTDTAAEPDAPTGQVQGTCTRECDVPMEERERRCERYLQEVKLARSGHGGHDTTFRVAKLICNDFGITNRESAMRLLTIYNERLRIAGEEAWSEQQIAHKITGALADALSGQPDPKFPFGGKLHKRADETPQAWDDPARLAREFLREHTVRFVKQSVFFYTDGVYTVVTDEWLRATVRRFVERAAEREYRRLRLDHQSKLNALHAQAEAPISKGETEDAVIAQRRAARADLKRLDQSRQATAPKVGIGLVRNTIEAIAVRAQLPDQTELDSWAGGQSGPAVLAVANGLLDPVARTLVPHSPDWFATAKLPVAHDTGARTPERWLAFLAEVMEGDAERVAVLQELFGASLDRAYPAKWFAALVGGGDNGKSVALAVLRFLLGGSNCSAVNLDELSTNRFAAFALFGKLANIVGDQGHFESADEGRLKSLTGGDLVTFEQKGRDSFVAVNRAKLLFAANSMPTFADKSEAVWNRLVAVPFEFIVPPGKKNPELLTAAYWADELPGILNWALDGLARLRKQGRFTRSVRCERTKNRTRLDSNPARQFLLAHCEFTGDDTYALQIKELYEAYRTWCMDNGFKQPLTKPRFGREARSAFPGLQESHVFTPKEGSSYRAWLGLRFTEFTVGA